MYFPYLFLVFTVTSSGSSILSCFSLCTLLCPPVKLSTCPFVIYFIGSILFSFLISFKNGGFVGEKIILILFLTLTPTVYLAVKISSRYSIRFWQMVDPLLLPPNSLPHRPTPPIYYHQKLLPLMYIERKNFEKGNKVFGSKFKCT